ncbi:MAG: translation initiation factor eIF-2B [Halobacteriales archaeon]
MEDVDFDDVDEVVRMIEEIEIQGATSVAEAGVEVLRRLDGRDASQDEVDDVTRRLVTARPTEPFLFNCVRVARHTGDYDDVLDHVRTSKEAVVASGVDLLSGVDAVYTHCHSSTATALVLAGDVAEAHVTETRPLYQGRETASELAAEDVDVEFYVDSGARMALKQSDAMLIGADAVLADGRVVNKIGSELFAETAQRHGVPVYVVTDSWKYDPASSFGFETEIERRAAREVWSEPPDGVEVVNYAFEKVSPDVVDAVVSELGVHDPVDFQDAVVDAYPELLEAVLG